jgi:hypothetical protein
VGFGFGRIDYVYLAILRSIIAKPGGWVNLKRCSYDKENICSDHLALCLIDLRYRFSEEYNMRTELPVVLPASVPEMYLGIPYIHNLVFTEPVLLVIYTFGPYLRKLAMQMDDVGATCSFMQVVYILRNDSNVKIPFHTGQKVMRGVGLHLSQIGPSLIIEFQHLGRSLLPSRYGCQLGQIFIVPETSSATERSDAALDTDAGSREDDYSFSIHINKEKE